MEMLVGNGAAYWMVELEDRTEAAAGRCRRAPSWPRVSLKIELSLSILSIKVPCCAAATNLNAMKAPLLSRDPIFCVSLSSQICPSTGIAKLDFFRNPAASAAPIRGAPWGFIWKKQVRGITLET